MRSCPIPQEEVGNTVVKRVAVLCTCLQRSLECQHELVGRIFRGLGRQSRSALAAMALQARTRDVKELLVARV